MAHKTFGQKKQTDPAAEAPEPITFDLVDEKGITCREKVNGKLLIELVGKVDSGSVGKQSEGILQVFDVTVLLDDGDDPDAYTGKKYDKHTTAELQEAAAEGLTPGIDPTSSHGRLTGLLDDPDTEIDIDDLAELVGWLVEQYTGRPTGRPGSSPSGGTSTGHTSRRARRSQARATEKEMQRSSSTSSTEPSSTSV